MEENKKIKIIGIGNKGRHGKDTLAGLLAPVLENSITMHFATPLKEEVSYIGAQPLIFRKFYNGHTFYYLRDHVNTYIVKKAEDMPLLHKVFNERQINEYWYMAEKDPEILQVWGTDFRRQQNPQYWVQKIEREIMNLEFAKGNKIEYVLLPDTRFINEYDFVKERDGTYIKVLRLNDDGSLFIDPHRSPTHPSEIGLDHIDADITIKAKSGDLKKLEAGVKEILELLK